MTKPIAKLLGGSKKEPSPEPIKTRDDAAKNVNEADRVDAARRAAAANPLQTGPEGISTELTGTKKLGGS